MNPTFIQTNLIKSSCGCEEWARREQRVRNKLLRNWNVPIIDSRCGKSEWISSRALFIAVLIKPNFRLIKLHFERAPDLSRRRKVHRRFRFVSCGSFEVNFFSWVFYFPQNLLSLRTRLHYRMMMRRGLDHYLCSRYRRCAFVEMKFICWCSFHERVACSAPKTFPLENRCAM